MTAAESIETIEDEMSNLSQVERKRLDSLARNRASASLKLRHPDEWNQLYRAHYANLLTEADILGGVVRRRNPPLLHEDDGTGKCAHCGATAPCKMMRKRAKEKAGRIAEPVSEE